MNNFLQSQLKQISFKKELSETGWLILQQIHHEIGIFFPQINKPPTFFLIAS